MRAEIFSIGTEWLIGERMDTNAGWLAARLPALGIQLQGVSLIGDNLLMLTAGFRRALEHSDLILTPGGLGPTQDALTREAIAATLNETPTVDPEGLGTLEQTFRQRGRRPRGSIPPSDSSNPISTTSVSKNPPWRNTML